MTNNSDGVIAMAQQLPPTLQDKLRKYEAQLRTYEAFKTQNLMTQQELSEISMTLTELKKYPEDGATYKAVGSVMFLVDKAKLVVDLEEREGELKRFSESTSRKVQEFETKLTALKNELEIELGKQNLKLQ
ncbi:MAG: prefoldin subunit [Candidatus Thorarchaeota archaeon]